MKIAESLEAVHTHTHTHTHTHVYIYKCITKSVCLFVVSTMQWRKSYIWRSNV